MLATAGDQDPVPSWVDVVVVGDHDAVVDETGARVVEGNRAMADTAPPASVSVFPVTRMLWTAWVFHSDSAEM